MPTWDGRPEPAFVGGGGPVEDGPELQIPWMCGQVEYCTQGHNGGSHTGTGAWAWDFALQEGEEIWAASAGVVTHARMDSSSGGCDPAYSGDANYVVVDHGDGTSILYLHMLPGSSPLAVGEEVEVGDLVARVGETGYACGAHLHLQVMETCGGSYCNSLPATFAEYGDPVESTQYEGTNCPACGISLGEGETIIDDEDAGCFVRETTAWSSSYSGHEDHHFYTLATDAGAPESIGSWLVLATTPGDYRVEVFIPDTDAETTNAMYEVIHADGTDMMAIDQSVAKGWQELGTFRFAGSDDERVRLGDDTGENLDALMRRIAYDAVRLTYVPSAGTGTDGSLTEGDGSSGDGDDTTGVTESSPNDATTTPDGTGDGTEGGTSSSPPLPPGGDRSSDGCACRPVDEPIASPLLLLLAMVRRRRRRCASAK
jgi:MYXO-CTERM domain-containing protein